MRRILTIGLWFFMLSVPVVTLGQTALDRFIAEPESTPPTYTYSLYKTHRSALYTSYFIHMVSQQWRANNEVDRPFWEHIVEIIVPILRHSRSPNTAILLIDGGSNRPDWPTKTDDRAIAVAIAFGSVVAIINQVPNQPLFFGDEGGVARKEDALIAYSFDQFLKTGDPSWPVLLPMTKAVVRGMDTIQTFLADRTGVQIDDFIIVGASKRGWAAWLTAAVDSRVKAVAPASIDLLNTEEQFRRHFEAYGFYTPAVSDYAEFDLPNQMSTPEGQALLELVDPYFYRDRLKLPKIVLNATGDQFFLPDSSQFYYADLPDLKWLRYMPNTDHRQSLEVIAGLASWIDLINNGKMPPQYSWDIEADGTIRVETAEPPDRVRLWQATNRHARDFRLESIGPAWTFIDLNPSAPGVYRGRVASPPQGWTAYMIELTYKRSSLWEPNQVFTTDVVITPNTLPFGGIAARPDIKANQSDEPVQIATGENLQVRVSLDSGSQSGRKADWYVAASTEQGWYSYQPDTHHWLYAGYSLDALKASYSGELADLVLYDVLNTDQLPRGRYDLYFGIDRLMNGKLDIYQTQYDSVQIDIH